MAQKFTSSTLPRTSSVEKRRPSSSVVQLNYRHRERDSGAEAEPENSGATTVELSPGLTLSTKSMSTLYAYVQLPLYQDVNGIQLVPRNSFALGWTADF